MDIVKDWKSQMEILFSDIVSIDSSESVILQAYFLLFIKVSTNYICL